MWRRCQARPAVTHSRDAGWAIPRALLTAHSGRVDGCSSMNVGVVAMAQLMLPHTAWHARTVSSTRSHTCALPNSWAMGSNQQLHNTTLVRPPSRITSLLGPSRRWGGETVCAAQGMSRGEGLAAAGGMMPLSALGQVMSASSNMVRVELDAASYQEAPGGDQPGGAQTRPLPPTQLLCSLRSIIKKLDQRVLVGDRVRVGSIDWGLGKAQVEEVLPRSSELTDPAVANVDMALLVFALNNPPFEEFQVSRFLVSMEASGLPFRLVLNKADLVSDAERAARVAQVRSWGYEPLVVSCEGQGFGLDQVLAALAGRTSVVAGPSGAGKSSLINAVRLGRHRADQLESGQGEAGGLNGTEAYGMPPLRIPSSTLRPGEQRASAGDDEEEDGDDTEGEREQPAGVVVASRGGITAGGQAPGAGSFLAVGDLNRVGRGKHTTTAVTLIKLPDGGRLADTPGFSQPSLGGVSSMELSTHFPEFSQKMDEEGGCQFNNCQHMLEPGCCINAADPPMERHLIYAKLLLEIREREETDVKAMQAGKRAREGNAKLKAAQGGRVRAEAKLDASKHRRRSRTSAKQLVRDMWKDS